ncbi:MULTISPECIES: DUF1127 domain-containing protein [unclassified Bradyrhizobium]|uniref:DUF1127 domain-containing protein n=1 Tax=unclassified Bradyrhizobium TaxID=2631580 RepID=UPI0016065A96|nr:MULTISPECIES: DUF1127 domain-containing protein [unclassified Bradyrhizobium]MBB4361583.1 uncharacterized protein YjiS (DUF1127 family) [Bradyrhizobium sp. CIR18]MBB4392632.1 uncharacterized protein YjiS (DUF1127 family) [Bradyrhizobium sp. ERR14]
MPPQQTNITAATEVDAARRGLDLSIVQSLLRRYWRAFQDWRPRAGVALQDLSDRELMDIGLTRGEIDRIAPERAIDRLRDSTRTLWGRGGM